MLKCVVMADNNCRVNYQDHPKSGLPHPPPVSVCWQFPRGNFGQRLRGTNGRPGTTYSPEDSAPTVNQQPQEHRFYPNYNHIITAFYLTHQNIGATLIRIELLCVNVVTDGSAVNPGCVLGLLSISQSHGGYRGPTRPDTRNPIDLLTTSCPEVWHSRTQTFVRILDRGVVFRTQTGK